MKTLFQEPEKTTNVPVASFLTWQVTSRIPTHSGEGCLQVKDPSFYDMAFFRVYNFFFQEDKKGKQDKNKQHILK